MSRPHAQGATGATALLHTKKPREATGGGPKTPFQTPGTDLQGRTEGGQPHQKPQQRVQHHSQLQRSHSGPHKSLDPPHTENQVAPLWPHQPPCGSPLPNGEPSSQHRECGALNLGDIGDGQGQGCCPRVQARVQALYAPRNVDVCGALKSKESFQVSPEKSAAQ